jgi:hypothetical protein
MTSSTFLRRSAAVLVSTGAAAALALAPSAAHAGVSFAYLAAGNASASDTSSDGSTCSLTSAPGSDSVETGTTTFSHGTKHKSVALDATFADELTPSDSVRVKGHLDSKLTLVKRHHDLRSFALEANGSIKISHSISGSACSAQGSVAAGFESATFTEHKKGTLTLTRGTNKPGSIAIIALVDLTRNKAVVVDLFEGSHSKGVSHVALKPGTYAIEECEIGLQAGGEVILKSPQRTTKKTMDLSLTGEFKAKK